MHFSKRISLLAICTLIAGTPYASFGATPTGDKTVTSKSYVTTQLGLKQDKSTAVKYNGSTEVGSATKGVFVNADGTVSAMTYSLGKDVPSTAKLTDTVTTVTNSDGTAGASTAANGSIKVDKDGTVTYPVVKGWSTKENVSNKAKQGTATGSIFTNDSTDDQYPSAKAVYTALNAQSTDISGKQDKSTANYQMGKAGGGWTTMSSEQQNALNSGITSTKVGNYDTHIADTTKHITAAERTAWNAKEDSANKLPQGDATTPVITSTSDDTKFPTAKAVYTALNAQSTSAGNTYQPKSTAGYQMGKAGGGWETMSAAQQNALNSGITSTTKVTHTASTAVGSGTKGVYVDANGAVTAMSYSLGKDVPSTAELTDTVTTVTNSDGTAGASTAANGSIKVDKDGTVTYPVVQGWSTKENTSNKLAQGSATTSVIAGNATNDTKFPTVKAVADYVTGQGYITSAALPTVNDATLTIQKNGTTIDTFTANSATNKTINIQADKNVIETVKANGTALTVTNKAVDIPLMGAASSSAAGTVGLVPASSAGDQDKVLTAGRTWVVNSTTAVTNSDGSAGASTAANGSIKVTKDGTTTYPVVRGWSTKEDTSNKLAQGNATTSVISSNSTDDTKFPTAKAVADYVTGQGYITSAALPTVNDATLTIQKNGTTIDTFTANSATNKTINIQADKNVIETVKANGTALTVTNKAVDIPLMGAASSSAAGSAGLVPAPAKGDQAKVLTGAGTWVAQPTVNNATLTIQKNGTTIDTFTANAASNKTINVTVPTTVSELTDSANYELVSNKAKQGNTSGSIFTNDSTDDQYPSAKAVYTALNAQSTSAGNTYQPKSTAAYQMGKAGGGWETMSEAQQNALNSGITSAKVTTYDGYATTIAGKQNKSTANYQMGNADGGWTTMSDTQQGALNSGITSTKVTNYDNHLANTTVHITAAERTAWNAKENTSNKLAQGDATTSVIADNSTNDTKFPTVKAVANYVTSAVSGADISAHTVNGAPLSNTASYYYGSGVGGNTVATKTVSIPSITTLAAGQVIVVNPVTTSKTISAGMKLKLNDFDAYQIKYAGTDVGSSYYNTVWTANVPAIFVFDGSNWVFAGKGYDTTYSSMSQTHIDGNNTSNRLVAASLLNANYQRKANADYKVSKSDGTWSDLGTTLDTSATGYVADNAVTAGTIATALADKQPKSTAAYQMGNASGGWTAMTSGQQNALNSGITSTKVGNYDTHLADTTKHITAAERTAWNAKEDSANKLPQGDATTPVITSTSDDTKFPTAKAVYTALNAQSTSAGNTYQPKSTAAYQMGKAGGGWETMSAAQQNALNSGITSTTKVTHTASTAVGSGTKGVYVDANGAVTAMSYSLGKDVPSTAELTDTTYTFATGTTSGAFTVTPEGGSAQTVSIYGWSNKQNKPNKSGETTAADGKVLTYTSNSLDSNVAARYVQAPVATGDPNNGGTVSSLASIWVE